jgi:hypothetical protein
MDTKETLREQGQNRFLIAVRNGKVMAASLLAYVHAEDVVEWDDRGDTIILAKADTITIGQDWPALMPQPDKCSLVGKCEDETPECSTNASKISNCWPQSEPQPEQPCADTWAVEATDCIPEPEQLVQCPKWQTCERAKDEDCGGDHFELHKLKGGCLDTDNENGCPPCQPVPQEQGISLPDPCREDFFSDSAFDVWGKAQVYFQKIVDRQLAIIRAADREKYQGMAVSLGNQITDLANENTELKGKLATDRAEVSEEIKTALAEKMKRGGERDLSFVIWNDVLVTLAKYQEGS